MKLTGLRLRFRPGFFDLIAPPSAPTIDSIRSLFWRVLDLTLSTHCGVYFVLFEQAAFIFRLISSTRRYQDQTERLHNKEQEYHISMSLGLGQRI